MSIPTFSIKKLAFVILVVLLASLSLSACTPATNPETEADHEHEAESDHAHEAESDHAHDDRLPNEGAVIRFVTPTNGMTYKAGDEIVVEIEVENFDLSAEGNHWHLYVDGSVLSMVAGGATKTVIRDLEPGEHEIEAYLGLPTHEELEEGATLTITVTE
ncbi:MAG: hypothetical protein Fur0022_06300 [Anaerolineales bacterium]